LAQSIELPHVGESVTEAVIGKWLKKPGDRVRKYDPIVEVVTDKVTMEVPAPFSGTLTRIVAQEGATVPMGAVIAEMEPDNAVGGEGVAAVHEQVRPAAPAPDRVGTMITGANVGPTGGVFQDTSINALGRAHENLTREQPQQAAAAGHAGPATGPDGAVYSPVVLRLAAEHGVDLSKVRGTGLGGRVTKQDVLGAVAARGRTAPEVAGRAEQSPEDRLIELSPVRKLIASHMARSFREIPHAWSAVEVDVTGMVACRTLHREKFKAATGADLTYLAFTLHAVAQALRGNPLLNSSWEEGKVRLKGHVNAGIAVAAPDGLVVPVVHDADRESVAGLAKRVAPLITRAREGKLSLEDVQGGTFTLNNTGALGSVWGGAIINHPQAAILTTEAIVKRPVVVPGPHGDTIAVRSTMNTCLSFDHRVIDGAEAAAFMQDVRKRLEAITARMPIE
jgi:2-oxoisovalerate dehydrogenase E2 component (dihydrolipoyl transacylase)